MQSLRDHRKAKGLTVRALAEKVGVSRQAISDYERDKYMPSNAVFEKLHEVLELNSGNIFDFFTKKTRKQRYDENSHCFVFGCKNKPMAKSLCRKHYAQDYKKHKEAENL